MVCKNKIFIFLLLGLFMISFASSAWSENTFNNSLIIENLTFTGNENITRWLEVPEDTVVVNGFLNLSGFELILVNEQVGPPFQEASISDDLEFVGQKITLSAEIDSVGFQWYCSGTCSGNVLYQIRDELNNIVAECDAGSADVGFVGFRYCDFSPDIAINGTNYVIMKRDSNFGGSNVNIGRDGTNITGNRVFSLDNGTTIVNLANDFLINITTTTKLNITNPSLSINDTIVWNESGEFNTIIQTSNLASYINNYISSATAAAGKFLVPFIFHSDTTGILKYFNLIFNDNGFFEHSITFDSEINEGEVNPIQTKIAISSDKSITNAKLAYNGINYTTTIVYDGFNYTIVSNGDAPLIDSDTNYSFKFIISIDGVEFEGTTNNQTVLDLKFGLCDGVNNLTLLNMSLFDEGNLADLTGDIEFNAQIISKSSGEIIETTNDTFSNVHSGAICFTPIDDYNLYFLDAEIRYSSDDYATEFYYIQRADVGDYPVNLSLYSLNLSDSTEFSVTYKNNDFIFVEGAIVQLQRKYIGEDLWRVVEAPLTASGGEFIVHIDLNNVKYRASVVKDGELLDFFDNIVFNCDNELSGDCTHTLDGRVNPNNDIPIEELTDFSYSISVNEDDQTITVLFSSPSGTPASINVLLNQIDTFGNLTSCNTTVITSAGSITCGYTDSIESNILELSISKNGVQLAVASYANNPELDMDGINFFIMFLFMISLVGMAIASPEWMLIISVMVLMIGGTLLLVSGMNLVIGLGALAWLVVAIGIIIFKMAKQEDR